MKVVYKISFVCIAIFALLFSFALIKTGKASRTAKEIGKSRVNILCVGIDEVANNTDTMILLSIDTSEKNMCLLHIPRDTYFEKNTANQKINNIYSSCLAKGGGNEEALSFMRQSISQALAVPIDFYVSFDLGCVSDLVDSIGGVEVDIPCDMNYVDQTQNLNISLQKGIRTLNGEEALLFLRYRNTYVEGDLGRIDAQKIFISAFIDKMKKSVTPKSVASIAKNAINKCNTDIPWEDAFSLSKDVLVYSEEYNVSYITLPGEAIKDNSDSGLWYYVLNREATIDVLKKYYSQDLVPDSFDEEKVFVNEKNIGFENIYYASDYEYKTHSDEEISQIDIKLE